MYVSPPKSVFATFGPEDQAIEISLAQADLDRRGAELLEQIAAADRSAWRDRRWARHVRHVLRAVAAELRDRHA